MEEKQEYSVAKEMGIVLLAGFVIGVILLVISMGIVELI